MKLYKLIIASEKIKSALVFFGLMSVLALGCRQGVGATEVFVDYKGDTAVSAHFAAQEDAASLAVFVSGESETPVLGRFTAEGDSLHFRPVIPFTAGQAYEVRKDGAVLGRFEIVHIAAKDAPKILDIYPGNDTVPENLLKIYLSFSEPMQEVGRALDFVKVKDDEDTEVDIFLDLENELWNRGQTRLTLWLDPGRIKTDLIPNRDLGLPLRVGKSYTITVADNWKNASGQPLGRSYTKRLFVTDRDQHSPEVSAWALRPPRKGSLEPLEIDFKEVLDAVLALEAFRVVDMENSTVQGVFKLEEGERRLFFFPETVWAGGAYNLEVDSDLEDLAGNNLDRLFDTDLMSATDNPRPSVTKQRAFTIQ